MISLSLPGAPRVRLGAREGAQYQEVLDCLRSCFSKGQVPDVSSEHIERLLKVAVLDALGPRGQGQKRRTKVFVRRKEAAVEKVLGALSAAVAEWKVYLPVPAPSVNRTRTFGKVRFLPPNSREIRLLTPTLNEPRRTGLSSRLRSNVLACVRVKAKDDRAAMGKAVHEVRRTLDALDFLSPCLEAPYREPSLAFEPVQAAGSSAIVALGPKGPGWKMHTFRPRALSLEQLSILEPKLYKRVNTLLALESPTLLEARLVTALSWAGRAATERRLDEAFLFNVIALESALTKEEKTTGVTEKTCRRAALVQGGSYAKRKNSFETARKLYTKRSKLVHAGAVQSLTDEELAQAAEYCRKVLSTLLTRAPFRAMREEASLEEWFAKREFGC